jgi:hypothetical protein
MLHAANHLKLARFHQQLLFEPQQMLRIEQVDKFISHSGEVATSQRPLVLAREAKIHLRKRHEEVKEGWNRVRIAISINTSQRSHPKKARA